MVIEISDMAGKENEKILELARILERWENTPTPYTDPYSDMSDIEKSKLILLLMEQRDYLRKLQEEMRQREEKSSRERDALLQRIAELMEQICKLTKLIEERDRKISNLQSRLDVANRNVFVKP